MLVFIDNEIYNGSEPYGDDDHVRSEIGRNIDAFAAYKRIQLAGTPSPEYAAWGLKLAEALAGGGEMLVLEASIRGISENELIAKVLANADAYKQAEAFIAGTTGKMKDTLLGMTRDQMLEFDWRF